MASASDAVCHVLHLQTQTSCQLMHLAVCRHLYLFSCLEVALLHKMAEAKHMAHSTANTSHSAQTGNRVRSNNHLLIRKLTFKSSASSSSLNQLVNFFRPQWWRAASTSNTESQTVWKTELAFSLLHETEQNGHLANCCERKRLHVCFVTFLPRTASRSTWFPPPLAGAT